MHKSQSKVFSDQSIISNTDTKNIDTVLNISPNNESVTCRQSRALVG